MQLNLKMSGVSRVLRVQHALLLWSVRLQCGCQSYNSRALAAQVHFARLNLGVSAVCLAVMLSALGVWTHHLCLVRRQRWFVPPHPPRGAPCVRISAFSLQSQRPAR